MQNDAVSAPLQRDVRHSELLIVTNIGELFDALAVGWTEGSASNRFLIAGDGGQFVRVPASGYSHLFYSRRPMDIPVESGGYQMRGFIRFESGSMFAGMFKTSFPGDGAWCSAELTNDGFRMANLGLLDFCVGHRDIKISPFFNPKTRQIAQDAAIAHKKSALPNAELTGRAAAGREGPR